MSTHLLGLLGAIVLFTGANAYSCETAVAYGQDNYGPGVSDEAIAASTPFEVGDYNAMIAFDYTHCIKMCCEQTECFLAVFNEVEAVCYLKGEGALQSYNAVEADGMNTFTISSRTGNPEPLELEPTTCSNKRGLAYGFTDSDDLYTLRTGVSWWYDWSPGALADGILKASLGQGSEYVPMIWGEGDLTEERLQNLECVGDSSSYLLGFNEPNYGYQSNLEPAEAAQLWCQVRAVADTYNMSLVSPAVNYCYGNCVREDPYEWLDEFLEESSKIDGSCGVDYLAVHTYSCEVKYINKHIHGYLKYGLPIWLTEFACGYETSGETEQEQAQLLSDTATYLELHPDIYRYAWFTGRSSATDGIEESDLLTGTGELTEVGEVFVEQYANLQHCSTVEDSKVSLPCETDDYTTSSEPSFNVDTELDVDPDATVITKVVFKNVGGAGYYDKVTDMIDGTDLSCDSFADSCIVEEVCVEGDLAPFDEVSIAFRGPMNVHNIAWYEGNADETLERTSSWTPDSEENIVFMNNRGGATGCSGVWSICGGNGQSYADASGSWCAAEPTHFEGILEDDNEINIMTSWECASEEQCGFFRDVGMRGWTGGEDGTKVLMFEVDMPHCSEDTCIYNRPAVWALNAQVFRTAQYGCNCRGVGGNGGCGEFDIVEAIVGNEYSDMLFSSVFDFKGASSSVSSKYLLRPSVPTTYAAVFRGGSESYLQVVQLDSWDFSSSSASTALLDAMFESTTEFLEIYDVDSRSATEGCSGVSAPSDNESTTPTEAPGETPAPTMSVVPETPGTGDGLAEGYEYIGCFADRSPISKRDMALRSKRSFDNNGPDVCAAHCMEEPGSAFFGLQNSDFCWCGGMGDTGPGSYGEATNCEAECPGDSAILCGGKMASSVYVLPVAYDYMGCFADERGDRDMLLVPKTDSNYLTPGVCAAYCSSVEGAMFFGVQNGRKCYCGESYGKHGAVPQSSCDEPCTGDETQVCGASNINGVYALPNIPEDRAIEKELNDDDSWSGGWVDDDDYENSSTNSMAGTNSTLGHYLGCFRDSPVSPLLDGLKLYDSYELTTKSCHKLCSGQGFEVYGVEWSVICFCAGNQESGASVIDGALKLEEKECYLDCPGNRGDDTETCGGQDAIQIWEI